MDVGYIISSHINYAAPLARLLKSMATIDPRKIFIAIGGHMKHSVEFDSGMMVIKASHNSFDHTGAIEFATLNPRFPNHVFFLHDTTELLPDAEVRIKAANPEMLATAASSASGGGQSGLILCQREYVVSKRERLEQFRNCTKIEAIYSEGILWKDAPPDRRAIYQPDVCRVIVRPRIMDSVPRLTELYESVGILKHKANWGQDNLRPVTAP